MKRNGKKDAPKQETPKVYTQADLLRMQADQHDKAGDICSRKADSFVGIAGALTKAAVPEAFKEVHEHLNNLLQALVDQNDMEQDGLEEMAKLKRLQADQIEQQDAQGPTFVDPSALTQTQ